MPLELLPVSVVIPTRNREPVLRRTLESLAKQTHQPSQLIIVDASDDTSTRLLFEDAPISGLRAAVRWQAAEVAGAASQRNQGVRSCSEAVIGFMDDDVLLEPFCFSRLWAALQSDNNLGGVNAMIINQSYETPGQVSRRIFRLMAGRDESSYAGQVLGPVVNLLPQDREDLPDVVPVEWLNTTCTLYRRVALPDPPFPPIFTGYSLMEDVALSVAVRKDWKLANARTARIYHDSQPGTHKSDPARLAEMQLVNRHYVMTQLLGRNHFPDYLKLILFELFSVASTLLSRSGRAELGAVLRGKTGAIKRILASS